MCYEQVPQELHDGELAPLLPSRASHKVSVLSKLLALLKGVITKTKAAFAWAIKQGNGFLFDLLAADTIVVW